MTPTSEEAGETLRANGLRSTPQRRAILAAFRGDRTEHLSAEEVYSRAAQSLPELSRGTVYATLAEFSELGLLSVFGAPEPVRYETNTIRHAHFRCRLCLRVFDLEQAGQDPPPIAAPGFHVERVDTVAEGICVECVDYESGLTAAARAIKRSGSPDAVAKASAASETQSPVGAILLAATSAGLSRMAFEDHADVEALRALASSRRGTRAARGHLAQAQEWLRRYFAGDTDPCDCEIDWDTLSPGAAAALAATTTIPYAGHRSYSSFELGLDARELGTIMGGNPIPVVVPCHRVNRGSESPTPFVGGPERRRWLLGHEQGTAIVPA